MFKKILIANRGEIACRVMKTAKKLGVNTVSIYSDIDQNSKHVSVSDEAYYLGGNKSSESYLNMDKIIDIAKMSKAEAIHPGYGFLSENVEFVRKCNSNGIKFIGPPENAIQAMGSKIESKLIMIKNKVPIVPGYNGENQDKDYLIEQARKIKYPIMIKADLGGGGKGMRIVRNENEFFEMLSSAQNEASKSFKSAKVLLEKYIENSKHIEVQVFGDEHGNYLHFFERDCTIQRRHQKVVEEAPSFLDWKTRNALCDKAILAAKAVGYQNAGTVEFIYDIDTNEFYFMEMNTRLQVEHPISEMITKQDFVELQLRIASGQPLPLKQEDVKIHGHAIECRVYSEDPSKGFLPGSGKIDFLREPNNRDSAIIDENVRVETGIRENDEVSIFYDPMISKLVAFAENRDLAIQKTIKCLESYKIHGLPTNLEFIYSILNHPVYKKWDFDTNFISKHSDDLIKPLQDHGHTGFSNEDLLEAIMVKVFTNRTAYQNLMNSFRSESTNSNKKISSPWNILNSFRVNYKRTREFIVQRNKQTEDSEKCDLPNSAENYKLKLEYLAENKFNLFLNNELIYENFECCLIEDNKLKINIPKKAIITTYFHLSNMFDVVLLKNTGEQRVISFVPDEYGIDEDAFFGDVSIIKAPMSSTISKIFVKPGQTVKKGESLIALEAMKMEHILKANKDGVVKSINCEAESFVEEGQVIIEFEKNEEVKK